MTFLRLESEEGKKRKVLERGKKQPQKDTTKRKCICIWNQKDWENDITVLDRVENSPPEINKIDKW